MGEAEEDITKEAQHDQEQQQQATTPPTPPQSPVDLTRVQEWLEEAKQEEGSKEESDTLGPLDYQHRPKTEEEQLEEDILYNFPPSALVPRSSWEFVAWRKQFYEQKRRGLQRKRQRQRRMNNQTRENIPNNNGGDYGQAIINGATTAVTSVAESAKGSQWGRSSTDIDGTREVYGCCHYLLKDNCFNDCCIKCCNCLTNCFSNGGCCFECYTDCCNKCNFCLTCDKEFLKGTRGPSSPQDAPEEMVMDRSTISQT